MYQYREPQKKYSDPSAFLLPTGGRCGKPGKLPCEVDSSFPARRKPFSLSFLKHYLDIRSVFLLASILMVCAGASGAGDASESGRFEDPADFPLMGDWEGQFIRPDVDPKNNRVAAQLICIDETKYRLRILPALYRRADPYLETDVVFRDGQIVYRSPSWELVFKNGSCQGVRDPHGKPIAFEMKPVHKLSPTLGQKAPQGAIVLFDGTDFDSWYHYGTKKPLTWTLLKSGVMETVSGHWNNKENRKKGIGGSIVSRRSFGDMLLHIEFRYPVEPGLVGQRRGNSGLTLSGFKEIQILNSYGLAGYWNECGALYRYLPPKVNAAAPPLQWQTYDVEIRLPRANSMPIGNDTFGSHESHSLLDKPLSHGDNRKQDTIGYMTVRHNGQVIHKDVPMDVGKRERVTITLQDHWNRLQFRNIWVVEKRPG